VSSRPVMLRCEQLWKIFGSRSDRILGTPKEHLSREELFAQTGCLTAVRDVSLTVGTGEMFVVMGLSGSGKSTLVRCLSRLVEPTAGRIEISGEDVMAYGPAELRTLRRRLVSMVFQDFGLLPNRRVIDNVAYGLEIQGVDRAKRRARAGDMIDLVGLAGFADYYPDQLSGGMRQRVGLARALANDPKLLLLDEPFSALDPLTRRDMQEEVLRLQEQVGTTMLFITHDLREALRLGDRIALMRDGELVQVGTPAELLTRPADEHVRDFTRDAPRALVLTAGDLCTLDLDPTGVAAAGPTGEVPAATTLQELIPSLVDGRALRVIDGTEVIGTVTRTALLAAIYGQELDVAGPA
jgi:glycine betaine/proline transport system ATP-binding protein